MSGPDIFLSYNREDAAVAQRYAEAFKAEGFDVWWDAHLRSGEAYDEVTEKALRGAKAVVVLWSPRSVESRWVRAEATLADRNKVLVPAMIEPCDRPIMFELTQTAELAHWDGDPFDRPWQAFLTDVRGFVERGRAKLEPKPAASPAPARRTDIGRPSLAIMPFANRSGETADDIFAEGMVDDLVAALSTNSQIKVIASSATRIYRDTAYDVRQVGQDLGARYLLEGNVRRVGEHLRVTSQLVATESGAILWTQKYDRALADLAELQEELVNEVAAHLGVEVQRIEIERALRKPGDLTAWEAILRSTAMLPVQTPEALTQAVDEARKAVELAPDYGLAHAQLAHSAAINFWQRTGSTDMALQQESLAASGEALRLDPHNPRVLSRIAEALCICGEWEEGQACAEQSVAISPDSDASHRVMVMVCNYFIRPEEALKHLDALERIAPLGNDAIVRTVQRAGAHFMAGDVEQALEVNRRALRINPHFHFATKDKVIYLELLGRHDEAVVALKALRKSWPSLTLEHMERLHTGSVLAPSVARQMYDTFAKVWHAAEQENNPG